MQAGTDLLQRWLGVTRVAQLTGLDRTGVEVAAAVRPRGHVLQVTNGKGASFDDACRGALSEAAELWGAEHVDPARLGWGTTRELSRGEGRERVWGFEALRALAYPELSALPRAGWSSLRCAWLACQPLAGPKTRGAVPFWLPAQLFHCLPEGSLALGPQVLRWTTNGMGAHPFRDAAVTHALLEAVERDQLARSLPQGWTRGAVRARRLAVDGRTPLALREERAFGRHGFDVFWFDLTPPRGAVSLPTVAVLLADRERGPVALTAGYACGLTRESALLGALREAAQSRLTDIHGAREDVVTGSNREGEAAVLIQWCRESRPRRSVSSLPRDSRAHGPAPVLTALRRAGHAPGVVADLSPEGAPLHVVKVVVPTLKVSALL